MSSFLYWTITFFHSWKWINGINFCKINYNLSLYIHISRIYPYSINVYKTFVQTVWKIRNKNFHVYEYLFHPTIYIYIYIVPLCLPSWRHQQMNCSCPFGKHYLSKYTNRNCVSKSNSILHCFLITFWTFFQRKTSLPVLSLLANSNF